MLQEQNTVLHRKFSISSKFLEDFKILEISTATRKKIVTNYVC